MTLLEKYIEKFGFAPPKLKCTSYEEPTYQKLLAIALETGNEITDKQVSYAYRGRNIDIKLK